VESHPETKNVDCGEPIFVVAVIGVVVGIAREEKKGLVLV
jgi:hypothetical protein